MTLADLETFLSVECDVPLEHMREFNLAEPGRCKTFIHRPFALCKQIERKMRPYFPVGMLIEIRPTWEVK